MEGRRPRSNQRFEVAEPSLERLAPKIPIDQAKQVKEHERRWSLLGQKIHALCRGMEPKLERVEVEAVVPNDHNLSVEDAARRQGRTYRLQQLRKVTLERLFVTTLDQDLIALAKHQRAKAIPLRFEDPLSLGG